MEKDQPSQRVELIYAILRRYGTDSVADAARRIKHEFVTIIGQASGFPAYYDIDQGPWTPTSISFFEDRISAALSSKLTADWVGKHPSLLPEPPGIFTGEVVVHKGQHGTRDQALFVLCQPFYPADFADEIVVECGIRMCPRGFRRNPIRSQVLPV